MSNEARQRDTRDTWGRYANSRLWGGAERSAVRHGLHGFRQAQDCETSSSEIGRWASSLDLGLPGPSGWTCSARRTSAKLRTREARTALPFSAEPSDGRPMTPEVV